VLFTPRAAAYGVLATPGGIQTESPVYCAIPTPICFRFEAQVLKYARSLAEIKLGSSKEARIAMIATTTNNSIT